MRVEVRDGGEPYRSNITTVRVNVNRNFHRAAFPQSRYTVVVSESDVIGTQLLQVNATDQDRMVISQPSISKFLR